jgi:hypothetical protein
METPSYAEMVRGVKPFINRRAAAEFVDNRAEAV